MTGLTDLEMSKAEFRVWVEAPQRERAKFEWVAGRVVQMANVTRAHAQIVANVVRAMSAQLDLDHWRVLGSDLTVEQARFIRVPDVLVEPLADDDRALGTDKAVILVEVLSPSTVRTDFVDKLAEYTAMPSLEAYIVASQDEAKCWLWQRDDDGTFPVKADIAHGRDRRLVLRERGIELPLAALYRGTKAV